MFQHHLDALIAFASSDRYREELLKAKAHFFSRTGEVFEDDRSFEMRMAGFLDFYLFDWRIDGKTPAEHYRDQLGALSPEEQLVVRAFTETRHSLWEVRKLGKDLVRLRDCFSGKDIDVLERRQPAGLKKGDLIEARLIPMDGHYLFSTAFCFHPDEVRKNVVKQIKRLKKEEPGFDPREFVFALAKMRLKFDRYRNIAADDIYAFDRKTI